MNERSAEFRARREACGLSREDIALACETDARDVATWEGPLGTPPPVRAWNVIEAAEDGRERAVEAAAAAAAAFPAAKTIQLTYYASQEQYDALGRDEGPYGVANANARAIAERLSRAGREVSWSYPTDPGNIYHHPATR